MIIIAKNVTASDIEIVDLTSQILLPGIPFDLTDHYSIESILNSDNLITLVQSGDVVINDGTSDLNITNGTDHLDILSEWEAKFIATGHNIDDHLDVKGDTEHGKILQYYTHPVSGLSGTVGTSGAGWYNVDGSDLVNISNYEMSFNTKESEYAQVKQKHYTAIASFLFEGTEIWTPEFIQLVVSRSENKTTLSWFRIWDYTNNLMICEVSWDEHLRHVIHIPSGDLSNMPTGNAIWEIQLKASGKTKTRLHYITIR